MSSLQRAAAEKNLIKRGYALEAKQDAIYEKIGSYYDSKDDEQESKIKKLEKELHSVQNELIELNKLMKIKKPKQRIMTLRSSKNLGTPSSGQETGTKIKRKTKRKNKPQKLTRKKHTDAGGEKEEINENLDEELAKLLGDDLDFGHYVLCLQLFL